MCITVNYSMPHFFHQCGWCVAKVIGYGRRTGLLNKLTCCGISFIHSIRLGCQCQKNNGLYQCQLALWRAKRSYASAACKRIPKRTDPPVQYLQPPCVSNAGQCSEDLPPHQASDKTNTGRHPGLNHEPIYAKLIFSQRRSPLSNRRRFCKYIGYKNSVNYLFFMRSTHLLADLLHSIQQTPAITVRQEA